MEQRVGECDEGERSGKAWGIGGSNRGGVLKCPSLNVIYTKESGYTVNFSSSKF